jgi:tetratricopeptide (TPR) repeat protein
MSWQTGAAEGWAERDVRDIELKAATANLGIDNTDLELLLPGLLTVQCTRMQLQPLLELAWSRLIVLREHLATLRAEMSDAEPGIISRLDGVREVLSAGDTDGLLQAHDTLGELIESAASSLPVSQSTALHHAHGLCAAMLFDFLLATQRFEAAAELAGDDVQLAWPCRQMQAECLLDHGREFTTVDSLNAAVTLCDEVLLPLCPADTHPDERAWTYNCQGQALGMIGRQESATARLDQAVTAFHHALDLQDKTRNPFDWAATQNHLGNAIGSLGQRQHDLAMMDRAVKAFEAAIDAPVSNNSAESRASAHNNLGAILLTIAPLREEPELFQRAIDSYRTALSIWTAERKPIFWATTMTNAAGAMRRLGIASANTETLTQSVDLYRAALEVRTRDRMARDWAKTQNDLGAALQALGELTEDTLTFGRCITAFREALTEIDRNEEPMAWALTQMNLGVSRRKHGEYQFDLENAARAVNDIQLALEVFRGASHAPYTDLALEQLAIAMEVHAELVSDTADQD